MSDAEPIKIRTDALTWRLVDGEVIVLDRRNWAYISINDSGALLWQRLVDGATQPQLTAALVADFEVDEQRASGDVEEFLEMLRGHGLLARGG
jgi:hypothetical protein